MNSKLSRLKLSVSIVLLLGIITGVQLICITIYYHRILAVYFTKTERQHLVAQLSSIYLLGVEVVVCYAIGLSLWLFIWKSEAILEYTKLLAALHGFCILVFLCGTIAVWFQYCSVQYLKTAAETALFRGMDLYFSEPEWKLLWDKIQYENQCCGVNGFDDWSDAVWMPEDHAIYETNILFMIPFACCKRSAPSCYQNYAPHVRETQVSYINSTAINTKGCSDMFCDDTCRLFYYAAGAVLIVFLLQIILFFLGLITISKAKKNFFGLRDCYKDNDERPIVIVTHPRNVRCVTLTDEENFDDVDEKEGDERCSLKCRPTEGIFLQQKITLSSEPDQNNVFLH